MGRRRTRPMSSGAVRRLGGWNCADQAELDRYWDRFVADGGTEGQCGWLKDKFGLSWQICPSDWETMLLSDDREAVDRALAVMFTMKKLDVAALQAAFDGE